MLENVENEININWIITSVPSSKGNILFAITNGKLFFPPYINMYVDRLEGHMKIQIKPFAPKSRLDPVVNY